MSLTLRIDAARWRAHLQQVAADTPGLIPVTKGNGYGFGSGRAAAAAAWLDVAALAVGLPAELHEVRDRFGGDLLVLQPWQARTEPLPAADPRVIRTVADLDDRRLLAESGVRHVTEVLTSMRRFGVAAERLAEEPVTGEGVALHLPLDAAAADRVAEVDAVVSLLTAAGRRPEVLWVSHLGDAEAAELRTRHSDIDLRLRIGTRLWLGDPAATRVTATVLAVHRLRRGDRFGYRQRRAAREASLLVVSGGTAHGIGLAAAVGAKSLGTRGKAAARGVLESAGRSLSPFRLGDRRLWFAEPPHMQVSMLLADPDAAVAVGDELSVDVRMTTLHPDLVIED